MRNIVFLILRRMRQPLLTLLVVYAISVLGLTLIPGRDGDGNLWHMSIFHAFYFVSYMATTIGFGEIPHTFSDAQRLWVNLSLPFGALMLCLFGTFVWGLRKASDEITSSSPDFGPVAPLWRFFVRVVCPISITIILVTLVV